MTSDDRSSVVARAIVVHSRERHDEMYVFFAMVCISVGIITAEL